MKDFIEILCTKFQRCLLITYFVTVDLVMSPKITALRHSAYVVADSKVTEMKRLNESQLKAQAVRLFEENCSYSVIAKKQGHSKAWVSKWSKRWKTNPVESSQSQSRR